MCANTDLREKLRDTHNFHIQDAQIHVNTGSICQLFGPEWFDGAMCNSVEKGGWCCRLLITLLLSVVT